MTKISNRQIAKNMKKFIGKRVLIDAGEHEGIKGTLIRVALKNGIKPVMIAKLDTEIEIEVKATEIIILVMEGGVQIDTFPDHLNASPEIQSEIDLAQRTMDSIQRNRTKFDS